MKRVVITGMGIVTGLGTGKGENLSGITEGRDAVREITLFDTSAYGGGNATSGAEARNFKFPARLKKIKTARYDRAAKLVLVATDEAFEEAAFEGGPPVDTCVILGTTLGGMISGTAYHREILAGRPGRHKHLYDYLACSQAADVSMEWGLTGQSFTVSNACASGANAIGFAFREIRSGRLATALAGGFDTMCEFTYAGFNSLQAITRTRCSPFDKNRDGLALGEGAAVLVMEELGQAKKRGAAILAEITGYGESSDAFHITRPEPTGAGAAAAIKEALTLAGIAPPDIDYINAHGTATIFNDAMEAQAIKRAFGAAAKTVPVSSVKAMIGHTLGGAGAAEAVISVLALRSGILPPNINYTTPDPDCDLNIVDRPGQKASLKRVMSNSFGFGGANAVLVMQSY